MTPDTLEKLRSDRLRVMAETEDKAVTTVVVKVAGPIAPSIAFQRSERGLRPFEVTFGPGDAGPAGASLEAAADKLRDITGRSARIIEAADALVVQADGAQLRRIAALPEVQDIYPNDLS